MRRKCGPSPVRRSSYSFLHIKGSSPPWLPQVIVSPGYHRHKLITLFTPDWRTAFKSWSHEKASNPFDFHVYMNQLWAVTRLRPKIHLSSNMGAQLHVSRKRENNHAGSTSKTKLDSCSIFRFLGEDCRRRDLSGMVSSRRRPDSRSSSSSSFTCASDNRRLSIACSPRGYIFSQKRNENCRTRREPRKGTVAHQTLKPHSRKLSLKSTSPSMMD